MGVLARSKGIACPFAVPERLGRPCPGQPATPKAAAYRQLEARAGLIAACSLSTANIATRPKADVTE